MYIYVFVTVYINIMFLVFVGMCMLVVTMQEMYVNKNVEDPIKVEITNFSLTPEILQTAHMNVIISEKMNLFISDEIPLKISVQQIADLLLEYYIGVILSSTQVNRSLQRPIEL